MTSSIRFSIWRGEQCDLDIECRADSSCHVEIEPQPGGDHVVMLKLSLRAGRDAGGDQSDVDQAAHHGSDADPVDNANRNIVGVGRGNEIRHRNSFSFVQAVKLNNALPVPPSLPSDPQGA